MDLFHRDLYLFQLVDVINLLPDHYFHTSIDLFGRISSTAVEEREDNHIRHDLQVANNSVSDID